jgi:DMSO/TMAO reductase YedYZ heme-binding membrane subunit
MNLAARLSEITAILLFVTSNNISQKMMGIWWKRIQKLSYIYFISAGLYIASFGDTIAYYCI